MTASVELARPGAPKEINVKLRVSKHAPLRSVTVNGRPAQLSGKHADTVIVSTGTDKYFEVVGQLS